MTEASANDVEKLLDLFETAVGDGNAQAEQHARKALLDAFARLTKERDAWAKSKLDLQRRLDATASADAVKLVDAYGDTSFRLGCADSPLAHYALEIREAREAARTALLDAFARQAAEIEQLEAALGGELTEREWKLNAEIGRLTGEFEKAVDIACRERARAGKAEAELAAKDREIEQARKAANALMEESDRFVARCVDAQAELARLKAEAPTPAQADLAQQWSDNIREAQHCTMAQAAQTSPSVADRYPTITKALHDAEKAALLSNDATRARCLGCDGLGEWDEGPINTGGPAPMDPEYRQVKCPACGGTGNRQGGEA